MRFKTIIASMLLYFNLSSQIVINEIQMQPAGSSTGSNPQNLADCTPTSGSEYIELFNTNSCQSVDISCYIIASNVAGTSASAHGAFRFPAGTIIPPLGFVSIGGSASGATFLLNNYCATADLRTNPTRWYLPNGDGYMMLYNASGAVEDAVYWTVNAGESNKWGTDSDINTNPTLIPAGTGGCPSVSSLSGPANLPIASAEYMGQASSNGLSSSRQTDGSSSWVRNAAGTINNCNGTCVVASSFSLTTSQTNPTCGSSNGSATVTPNPAGAYTYTWTSPAVSTTNTATGLSSGPYTVTVGQGGCTTNTVITLTNSGSPTITATQTLAASCGLSDGSATVTATPGSTFTWSPSGGNASTATGLSATNYTITAELGGCQTTTVITIPSAGGPTITATQTLSASCGLSDGSATVTATPGSTFTWSPSGGNASTATGLSATNYTITAGLGGCSVQTVITIPSAGGPTITATQTLSASCGLSDGSATVTATPGSTFTWSPSGGNASTATGLSPTNYTITAGLGGCSVQTVITIPSAGGPTITATQTLAVSCGLSDGSATVTATPGSTFTWSPSGGNASIATGLSATNYTITASLSGCSVQTVITIPSATCCPASLTYSLSVTGNTVCTGSTLPCNYSGPSILINEIALYPNTDDGSIYGNTSLSGKEGEWIELFNPDWCNAVDISGYILGSYNSNVSILPGTPSASNGMSFVLPSGTIVPPLGFVVVRGRNAPAPPSGVIDVIVDNVGGRLCIDGGVTTSRIWFQNAGGWFGFYNASGVPQDFVKWGAPVSGDLNGSPCIPSTNSVTAGNTPLASATQAGTLVSTLATPTQGKTFVRIPDGGSWSSTEATINTLGTCNVPGGCVSGSTGASSCSGSASISMTSGTAPYTYLWNDVLNQTTATSYSLCGGSYTVVVKDANLCQEVVTVTISTVVTPTITSVSTTSSSCSNNNGTASITAIPSNLTYSWSPNISNTTNAANLAIGNYTVSVIDAPCSTSTIITITGTTKDISVTHSVTPVSCKNDDGVIEILDITSSNGPHLINFNNNGFSSDTIFSNLAAGIYVVTISDANNCSISEQINVNAEYAKPNILLPNVFTPNDDKVNDVWYPKVDCIEILSVIIYNRWGEKMAELNDVNDFWDGKSKGKEVPDGNYFFVFEAKSFAGETIKDKGTINLFR